MPPSISIPLSDTVCGGRHFHQARLPGEVSARLEQLDLVDGGWRARIKGKQKRMKMRYPRQRLTLLYSGLSVSRWRAPRRENLHLSLMAPEFVLRAGPLRPYPT